MKAVIQRTEQSKIYVDGKLISEIPFGLTVYLCIEKEDTQKQADYLAKKIANMRIFKDNQDKMNLSVMDIGGEVLLVSQFTLCADTGHGNRPAFTGAAEPAVADELYRYTAKKIQDYGISVKTGVFGANMKIIQHNDGPVTITMQC